MHGVQGDRVPHRERPEGHQQEQSPEEIAKKDTAGSACVQWHGAKVLAVGFSSRRQEQGQGAGAGGRGGGQLGWAERAVNVEA